MYVTMLHCTNLSATYSPNTKPGFRVGTNKTLLIQSDKVVIHNDYNGYTIPITYQRC